MDRDRGARLWNACLVGLVAVSVGWTFVLLLVSPADPTVPVGMRMANFVSYFTILSNVVVGIVAATLAVDPRRDGRWWRVLHLDALVCITVTAVVHLIVLRPLVDLSGAAAITDNLLHVAVPVAAIVGWLVYGPRPRIDSGTVLRGLIIPVAWIGYTLVRGAVVDWYPYPFLDVGDLGYAVALRNIAVVAAVFLVLGAVLSVIDRRLAPAGDAVPRLP